MMEIKKAIKKLHVRIALMSFLIALCIPAAGQVVKVSPQAGIHLSNVNTSGDSLTTSGTLGGYNVGLDFRIGARKSWIYFQPGAHFYQARMNVNKIEDLGVAENYIDAELQISQIKIPLNLGFYVTGSDGLLRVRATAGLTTSMVVDQSDTVLLTKQDTDFSTLGIGVNAGIGIDFSVLTLDLRYEHGSTKIYQSANGNMNFISLTAGFIIPPSM